jgi:hypothetical protein
VSSLRLLDMELTLSPVPQALDKAAAGRTTIVRLYFVVPPEQTLTFSPVSPPPFDRPSLTVSAVSRTPT